MPKDITESSKPIVSIVMGSDSDWSTMINSANLLKEFEIPFECKVVSAHRTPEYMYEYAKQSEGVGLKVIIAGAGGAAHLPGMIASLTTLPVIGVPVESKSLKGLDSLLSIVQMPGSTPVATMSIGKAGATNAAWMALRILALGDSEISEKIKASKSQLSQKVKDITLEFN